MASALPLLVTLSVAVAACGTAAGNRLAESALTADLAGDALCGPLLWRVRGPGGELDLFGTLHVAGEDLLPDVARERLIAARTVAMEVDLADVSPIVLGVRGTLPADQSLDRLIGPTHWPRLVAEVGGTVTESTLRRVKPWKAASLLTARMFDDPRPPMDYWFLRRARDDGKRLVFLETVADQLSVLERAIDARGLGATLEALPRVKALAAAIVQAYARGDLMALERLLNDALATTREAATVLLDERNLRWLPALKEMLNDSGGFVAVGAGHLPGRLGLLALLRGRGYRVTRAPGALGCG